MSNSISVEYKYLLPSTDNYVLENKEGLKKTKDNTITDMSAEASMPTEVTNALLSSKKDLAEKLEALIILADEDKLGALLQEDYIVRLEGNKIQEKFEPSKDGKTLSVTNTFSKIFQVRKNANIILHDDEMLLKLLTKAELHDKLNSTTTKATILHHLIHSNVKKDVQGEITAKLDQLMMRSVAYQHLMGLLAPAQKEWNKQERLELSEKFNRLKSHAENNIPKNDPKYQKVMQLYNTFQPLLKRDQDLSLNEKHNLIFDLSLPKTKAIFSKHRDLKFLIGEIISFILGLGVLYVFAAEANKTRTGHFGVFATPKTQLLVNDIENSVCLRK